MIGGVSAEAERQAVVHIDGATGQVLGKPEIRDLTRGPVMPCEPAPPPPPPKDK